MTRNRLGTTLLLLGLAAATVSAAVIYVDDNAPGDPGPGNPNVSDPLENGSSAHPFDTVQEAIDAAVAGDEVIVSPGTYTELIDFVGKDIVVRSTNPGNPVVVAATILRGGPAPLGDGTVVTCSDGTLAGFTIRNAETGVQYAGTEQGAYSPTVEYCVIRGCYYGINGYVPYQMGPVWPVFRNNVISGVLVGVHLDHQAFGGGVHATIQNNVILGDAATYGRGIVYRMHKCLPTVTGNIITGWHEGIELVYYSLADERMALMTYNDMWDNDENYVVNDNVPFDLTGVQGNISADPLWVNAGAGDFHLSAGSPCIDAADPNFVAGAGETDMDGEARIQFCRADIGPDESGYYRDCNVNGVADGCEVIAGGDFDVDGHVDVADFAALSACWGGPDRAVIPPAPGCAEACLAAFDFTADGDVDLADCAGFQRAFTGS